MRTPRSGLVALLAAAALALVGCGGSSGATKSSDGLTTLKVAYTPIYTIGALQLGIDHGFFKDEGLELQLQQVANPPAGIAAVAGGQVDLNYAPSIPIIGASSSGVGLKIVAPADGTDPSGSRRSRATRQPGRSTTTPQSWSRRTPASRVPRTSRARRSPSRRAARSSR